MTHLVPVLRPVLGTPFRRGDLYRRAGEVPSFHIAPARTGHALDLITGTVLGGGTVNCATPAWEVGPDGILYQPAANTPVVGYDPVTLRPRGLRAWGAVTNLIQWSESFNNAIWIKLVGGTGSTPVVTENYAISPAGTMTASRLVANRGSSNTTNDQSYIYQNIGGLSSVSHTTTNSVWMRSNTGQSQIVYFRNATGAGGSLQTVTNQWQRFSVTGTRTGSVSNNIQIGTRGAQGSDQSIDILIYGGQIQLSDFLGPYVPTTTTAASSTADVIDITSLPVGINNIRTMYARVRTAASGNRGIISLNDNTSSNRLELLSSGTDPKAVAVTSGSTVADLDGGTITANTTFAIAARFNGDSYAISVNGGPAVTDNAGTRAIVDRIFLGRTQAGEYLNDYIEEVALWTQGVSDASLQALSAS